MQSYHDRHPEVGPAAQWLPWRHPVGSWDSHWHTMLSRIEAPEQQASPMSCLCVYGLMTTHLLWAGP